MEQTFTNLLKCSLDDIAIDLADFKQLNSKSITEHTNFLELLLVKDNLEGIEDTQIELKDLTANGFLNDFINAFSLAVANQESTDDHINNIINSFRAIINKGYLEKDLDNIKMDIPVTNISNSNLF